MIQIEPSEPFSIALKYQSRIICTKATAVAKDLRGPDGGSDDSSRLVVGDESGDYLGSANGCT